MTKSEKCYVVVRPGTFWPYAVFYNAERAWDCIRECSMMQHLSYTDRCMTIIEYDLQ